jgi:hypothetical protein
MNKILLFMGFTETRELIINTQQAGPHISRDE